MNESKIRVGIVGCGEIAQSAIENFLETDLVEIAWVYNRSPEAAQELGKKYKIKVHCELESAAEDDNYHVVYIATPHIFHHEQALLFARHHKHLIIEKPITILEEHASEILHLCEEKSLSCTTFLHCRELESVKQVKKLIANGTIGEITYMQISFQQDRREKYWTQGVSCQARPTSWRHSKELAGGGNLIMNGSHYIDLIYFLTDLEIVDANGFMGTYVHDVEVEDTLVSSIKFNSNAIGQISCGTASLGNKGMEFKIFGTKGHIDLSKMGKNEFGLYTLLENDDFEKEVLHTIQCEDKGNIRTNFLKRFLMDIKSNKQNLLGGYAGHKTTEAINLIYNKIKQ